MKIEYDVFICHNSEDKPLVKNIIKELEKQSIKTWIDEIHLTPGKPWQMELEEQIEKIGAAAVFVGKNGIGPWQRIEIRSFLNEFANRGCPVIPVILINATTTPELPIFLKQMTWIDLRKDYQGGISRLCSSIKQYHSESSPVDTNIKPTLKQPDTQTIKVTSEVVDTESSGDVETYGSVCPIPPEGKIKVTSKVRNSKVGTISTVGHRHTERVKRS